MRRSGGVDGVVGDEALAMGYHWNELLTNQDAKTEIVLYVILPMVLLFIFCLTAFLIYQRCSRSKLSLANIIALDLQDTDSSVEILASLTANAERLNSTSSDTSDGVFLMVYLPPPYEEMLTKITSAASLTSGKDVECIKMEDLEAKLCRELKSRGHYV
ncbi:small integral membrane protein 28 [Tachysurus ichikawai]